MPFMSSTNSSDHYLGRRTWLLIDSHHAAKFGYLDLDEVRDTCSAAIENLSSNLTSTSTLSATIRNTSSMELSTTIITKTFSAQGSATSEHIETVQCMFFV